LKSPISEKLLLDTLLSISSSYRIHAPLAFCSMMVADQLAGGRP